MALDASYVGRGFPLGEPYQVAVEKIREFASATGETSPLCHDRAAARDAGYADVVAPPTFAIAVIARAQDAVLFDPALGLDFSRVVHGDQKFAHHRPIVGGDELSATVYIDSVRSIAGNEMLGVRTEVTDVTGAAVCTATGTLVVRREGS